MCCIYYGHSGPAVYSHNRHLACKLGNLLDIMQICAVSLASHTITCVEYGIPGTEGYIGPHTGMAGTPSRKIH